MYSLYYNEEVWVDIIDFPGYQVSNTGKVRNLKDLRLLGQQLNKKGYYTVTLRRDFESYTCLVHRLVAIAFIPNPEVLPIVNHKDENTINPNVENLEWCTQKYNINYGTAIERAKQTKIKNKLLDKAKEAAKIIKDIKIKNNSNKTYKYGIDYFDFVFSKSYNSDKSTKFIIEPKINRNKRPHKKHNINKIDTNEFSFNKNDIVLKVKRNIIGSVSYDITLKTLRKKISKQK